jgi:hypothetical protein
MKRYAMHIPEADFRSKARDLREAISRAKEVLRFNNIPIGTLKYRKEEYTVDTEEISEYMNCPECDTNNYMSESISTCTNCGRILCI